MDLVIVISNNQGLFKCYQLRLITLTVTFIILDITNTKSHNLFSYTLFLRNKDIKFDIALGNHAWHVQPRD